MKLRISRPAPASSITASAISTMTSAPRIRAPVRLVTAPRPLSFSACDMPRVAWKAGISPNTMPVTTASPSVNSDHGPIDAHVVEPWDPVLAAGSSRNATPQLASSSPTAAPPSESSTLSVSSWRISRVRGRRRAPRARRSPFPRGGRAREEQVGDVGAGDQQDEADRAEQHEHRLPDVSRPSPRAAETSSCRRSRWRRDIASPGCGAMRLHLGGRLLRRRRRA